MVSASMTVCRPRGCARPGRSPTGSEGGGTISSPFGDLDRRRAPPHRHREEHPCRDCIAPRGDEHVDDLPVLVDRAVERLQPTLFVDGIVHRGGYDRPALLTALAR